MSFDNSGYNEYLSESSYLVEMISRMAKNFNISVIVDNQIQYPAAIILDNIKKPVLILNIEQIRDEYKFTIPEMIFVLYHELQHYKEKSEGLLIPGGEQVMDNWLNMGEKNKLYHFIENIVRDIWVEHDAISPHNMPVLYEAQQSMGKKLFYGDLLEIPLHKQFLYALLQEQLTAGVECSVDPRVRNELNSFCNGRWGLPGMVVECVTGNLPKRLNATEKHLLPIIKRLLEEEEKDKKQKEDKEQNEGEQQGNNGNQQENNDNALGNGNPQNFENNNGGKESNFGMLPHIIAGAVNEAGLGALQEKLNRNVRREFEKNSSEYNKDLDKRLANMGLDYDENENKWYEIKAKLKEYDDFFRELLKKYGQEFQKIMSFFDNIKSVNSKDIQVLKGGASIEDAVELDYNLVAEGMAHIMATGNYDVDMFLESITKVVEKISSGKFEVSFVADGTSSMQSAELTPFQKQSVIFLMEVLTKLGEKQRQMHRDINFKHELFIFGKNSRRLKNMGPEMSDQERVILFDGLDENEGPANNESDLLEKMWLEFEKNDSQYKQQIQEGKIKKFIFMMTDGLVHDEKLTEYIYKFREAGVYIYGIGMTESGNEVLYTYVDDGQNKGFGIVVKNMKNLPRVMFQVLSAHFLKKIRDV